MGNDGRVDAPFLHDPPLVAVLNALPGARLVGGSVRDAIAGRPVADIDLATPQPPDEVIDAAGRAGLKTVPTGLRHGTVTVVSQGRGFEVTTLRRDVATDGRHATVEWTDDWREDAARRDFTINAMSMSPDGEVFDYFGGHEDLAAGRVRFVGDPALRIAEDVLRSLRFFRFFARYGTGEPDVAAIRAIAATVDGLRTLSTERVWSELKRILAPPPPADPTRALALMAGTCVLATILPEATRPNRLAATIARGAPSDALIRLSALIDPITDLDAFAVRLRLSVAERDMLHALATAPTLTPDMDDDDLRRMLADFGAATLIGRIWIDGGDGPDWAGLRARLAATSRPVFPLEGRDVVALGVPPGPAVGEALRDVRAWWLTEGCKPDRDACRKTLIAFLGKGRAGADQARRTTEEDAGTRSRC